MKINYLLCLGFFMTSLTSFAQISPWSRIFESGGRSISPIGWLSETDDEVQSLNQQNYTVLSHYGEPVEGFTVLTTGATPSLLQTSFLFDSREDAGETTFLQANRDRRGNLFFTLFNEQSLITELALTDSISGTLSRRGPGLVSLDNNEYWVFGNKTFHKVRWTGGNDLELIDTKVGDFGLIAAAAPTSDGYILCNEEGYLIATNQDAEVTWSKQLNLELTDVEPLNDGYILCGKTTDSLALVRTDQNGEILWQRNYNGSNAYELVVASNGDFVVTGDQGNDILLLRTDASGNLVWLKTYDDGRGINIIESRYGGFYVQSQIDEETGVMRVDENGETSQPSALGESILAINNIATTTNATGIMFNDNNEAYYRFPKNGLASTIFSSSLWLSARDAADDLYLSVQTYGSQSSPQDYQPGYIGSDPDQFDKVWSVTRDQIEQFRADQMQPNSTIPWAKDIITWPAKGNPNVVVNDESVDIPIDLAPFIDVNGDGIYNAFDGDYPKIIGDQMLFWVMNDATPQNTGGTPLEVDILCSMYAFSNEGVTDNVPATFVDFVLINRSDRDYKDITLGLFTDFDLGCFTDDYIGSMPEANAVYVYNQNSLDNQSCPNGIEPIAGLWPIQLASCMNQEMTSAMYFNSIISNPPPGTSDPETPEEYDRYLHAIWRDGTPLTTSGTGYNPGGGTPTSFMFPDNPVEVGNWTMCSTGLAAADRRTVMSAAVNTLEQGEQLRHSIAYLTLGEFIRPCPDIEEVREDAIAIRNYFNAAWPDFTLDLGPDTLLNPGANITLDAGPTYSAYDWSTGATSSTLLVTQPGIYSVVATTPLGFQRTDTIRVDFVTNTNELDLTAPMIFPNPSNGLLHVSPGTVAIESVEVRSMLGQSLRQIATFNSAVFQLNLSDLSPGAYFLIIKGSSGQQWLRKVILND